MNAFKQSWIRAEKNLKMLQENCEGSLIVKFVRKLITSDLSNRLYASTSHTDLNISKSHRHDSNCDVIRISLENEGLIVECFMYDKNIKDFRCSLIDTSLSIDEAYKIVLQLSKNW